MKLAEIQAPILEDLKQLDVSMREAIKSKVSLLDTITRYIIKSKGKQMRPMFVFLTARLFGQVNHSTYTAATMIELLHTATLVHDDVVDDSAMRRGFFSINAIWKNKIAVLIGDYLLSKGLILAMEHKEYHLLELMTESVKQMSEGELLQIEKARKLDITEAIYYDIIAKKTASLLATACATGCASVEKDEAKIAKARELGFNIGMAFQIKDDLFDYGKSQIGKPTGIDIKEQKMTLPLIYTLQNISVFEKQKIKFIVKYMNTKKDQVQYVIDKVIATGGIDYASTKMQEYIQKAKEILNEFEDSESKKSLLQLIDYTILREK